MNLALGFLKTKHGWRVLAKVLVCALFLALPACAVPGLRPAQMGLGVPESYKGMTSPTNSARMGIKDFYNDPVLVGLIDQALVGNRELKVMNEEVQIARNEILARTGAFLPLAALRGEVGVERNSDFTPAGAAEHLEYRPGRHFPDPVPNFLLGLNFLVPVDLWRELRNNRDAAAARFLVASERRNYFVTRLVADVAENYFGLMALDKRFETLNQTIELFEGSYKVAKAKMDQGRGTKLAVQRFEAEIRKYQSEKQIVRQDIIETENRINFLLGRFPQPVERLSARFFELSVEALGVGVPAELLQNRADIRQAERALEAAGLDVLVARAHFFPKVDITAGIGYQAFSPKYLFTTPEALAYNAVGEFIVPLINKRAIQAEYRSANARQLESVYNYQRAILNAFAEVVNRVSMVQNYSRSIEIKKQQLESLVAAVGSANELFQNARAEYIEVLLAQRDFIDARMTLIETKRQQLTAIANAYQALGGGQVPIPPLPDPAPAPGPFGGHGLFGLWGNGHGLMGALPPWAAPAPAAPEGSDPGPAAAPPATTPPAVAPLLVPLSPGGG